MASDHDFERGKMSGAGCGGLAALLCIATLPALAGVASNRFDITLELSYGCSFSVGSDIAVIDFMGVIEDTDSKMAEMGSARISCDGRELDVHYSSFAEHRGAAYGFNGVVIVW